MARFFGQVDGGRGAVHRLGHSTSGITVEARGWDLGVKVEGSDEDGSDVFRIYATGGSNGATSPQLIGTVTMDETGRPWFDTGSRGVPLA